LRLLQNEYVFRELASDFRINNFLFVEIA
jgi:hypothetical protein